MAQYGVAWRYIYKCMSLLALFIKHGVTYCTGRSLLTSIIVIIIIIIVVMCYVVTVVTNNISNIIICRERCPLCVQVWDMGSNRDVLVPHWEHSLQVQHPDVRLCALPLLQLISCVQHLPGFSRRLQL